MNSSEFFRTVSKFKKQRENHRPVFSSIKRELLGIFTSAVTTKKCTKSVMQVNRKCTQSCCLALTLNVLIDVLVAVLVVLVVALAPY